MARLIIHHDDTFIAEVELDRPLLTIGRRSTNNIVLNGDGAVSGSHAQIRVDGDRVQIEDLQSTNGTQVNETVIANHALRDGDVISIGRHRLQLAVSPGAEATLILGPEDGLDELNWPDDNNEPAAPVEGRLVNCDSPDSSEPILLDRSLTTLGQPKEQLAAVTKRKDGFFALCLHAGQGEAPCVNQQPLTRQLVRLNPGDVLQVGQQRFRLE